MKDQIRSHKQSEFQSANFELSPIFPMKEGAESIQTGNQQNIQFSKLTDEINQMKRLLAQNETTNQNVIQLTEDEVSGLSDFTPIEPIEAEYIHNIYI